MDSAVIVALISAVSSVVVSVFSGVMAVYGKKHAKLRKEEMEKYERWDELRQNVALGMRCTLRNSILEKCKRYIKLGYCPIHIKQQVEEEYGIYHNLGGNGTVTQTYKKFIDLPITEGDDDNED